MLCYVLMRLAYLELAVIGSLDRHDTYDVSKNYDKLRRTYDESSMHDRLGKHDHTRIIPVRLYCRHVVAVGLPEVTYSLGLGRTH